MNTTNRPRVSLDLVLGHFFVEPLDMLGSLFGAYREACQLAGFVYSPVGARKGSRGALADVPALVDGLAGVGVSVVLTDEARAALAAAGRQEAAPGDDALAAVLAISPAKPFPYQLDGVRYLRKGKAHLLHDDMGLGKTLQALLAVDVGGCAVVVSPASVKGSWAREVAKFRPDLTAVVLNGRGSFRWPAPGEVVITNFEITAEADAISPAPRGVRVFLDEAHKIKSAKAKMTDRARALCAAAMAADGAASLMTGTPLLNRPQELWTILQAVGLAARAFGSFDRFVSLFGGRRGRFGIEWDPNRIDERAAECLARVAFGRRKEDVLPDLPAKRYEDVPVTVDGKALKALNEITADMRARGFVVVDGVLMTSAPAK